MLRNPAMSHDLRDKLCGEQKADYNTYTTFFIFWGIYIVNIYHVVNRNTNLNFNRTKNNYLITTRL